MSESYDELVDEADVLRTNGNQRSDARRAIIIYREAIKLGGARDVHCQQQIGVCHQILSEYDEAIEAYLEAEIDASHYQRGNIERDMCESYSRLGLLDYAETSIATSLDLLPFGRYPAEHAASLSFLARLQMRQGLAKAAIGTFIEADHKLQASGNQQTELYNKLHLASALSQAGHPMEARKTAAKAAWLSIKPLDSRHRFNRHRVGAPAHHIRAVALTIGGHRGEELVKRLAHR